MNSAARALAEGLVIASAPTTAIRRLSLSVATTAVLLLSIAIIISALGIITVADNNRIAIGNLASLQQTRDHLHTAYGQLLLEENTWSAPSRVASIAAQNFNMAEPTAQQVVIVKP